MEKIFQGGCFVNSQSHMCKLSIKEQYLTLRVHGAIFANKSLKKPWMKLFRCAKIHYRSLLYLKMKIMLNSSSKMSKDRQLNISLKKL